MFHWICPECGREIPPAVKECPVCDPQAVPIAASPSTLQIQAEPIAAALPVILPAPEPVTGTPSASAAPEPEIPVSAVAPTLPVPPQPIPAAPSAPPPPAVPEPLLRLAQTLREAQKESVPAAVAAPAEPSNESVPAAVAAPSEPSPAAVPEPQPEPPREPEPEPVRTLIQPSRQLLLAAAPSAVALLAAVEAPVALESAVVLPLPAAAQNPVTDPNRAERVPVPELRLRIVIPAPKATGLEALAASVSAPPIAPEPSLAPSGLGLAPLRDSSSLGSRVRPAAPSAKISQPDAGPKVTLPGPALPRSLCSLQDAGISKILTDRPQETPKRSASWVTGILAASVLGATLMGLALYSTPHTSASAKPPAAESPQAAPEPAAAVSEPETPAALPVSYPLSKAVEVTGFRFTDNKPPTLHYLVVNHSSSELAAVTVYVTLRASNAKAGQPPLARFSFRSPALAAFESKEMVASLDKPVKTAADWQSLRADIEIGQ